MERRVETGLKALMAGAVLFASGCGPRAKPESSSARNIIEPTPITEVAESQQPITLAVKPIEDDSTLPAHEQEIPTPAPEPTPTATSQPVVRPTPEPTPNPRPKVELREGLNRELAQGFVERVNLRRKALGLTPLIIDTRLQNAAEKYALLLYTDGVTRGKDCVDASGNPVNCHMVDGGPWDRAQREGYPSTNIGEVLMGLTSDRIRTRGNISDEEVIKILLDPLTYTVYGLFTSPPHATALFSSEYTEIGVGCALGPDHLVIAQTNTPAYFSVCIGNLGRQ